MTSTDIDQTVACRINPTAVLARMFDLAEGADHMNTRHIKRASFSSCPCRYCSTIRRYVSAKMLIKKLDQGIRPRDLADGGRWSTSQIDRADSEYAAASRAKDALQLPTFDLTNLLPT